jgi:hypothetical protein
MAGPETAKVASISDVIESQEPSCTQRLYSAPYHGRPRHLFIWPGERSNHRKPANGVDMWVLIS